MEIISKSAEQTERIGAELAGRILKSSKGTVVALEGELGAGKTTFIKGFARALGIKEKIKSPTFVIMKNYKITDYRLRIRNKIRNSKSEIKQLYHLDCYRINDSKDLKISEFGDIMSNLENIVLIEWAERVREILPKHHIQVHIDHIDDKTRRIEITNN